MILDRMSFKNKHPDVKDIKHKKSDSTSCIQNNLNNTNQVKALLFTCSNEKFPLYFDLRDNFKGSMCASVVST